MHDWKHLRKKREKGIHNVLEFTGLIDAIYMLIFSDVEKE